MSRNRQNLVTPHTTTLIKRVAVAVVAHHPVVATAVAAAWEVDCSAAVYSTAVGAWVVVAAIRVVAVARPVAIQVAVVVIPGVALAAAGSHVPGSDAISGNRNSEPVVA